MPWSLTWAGERLAMFLLLVAAIYWATPRLLDGFLSSCDLATDSRRNRRAPGRCLDAPYSEENIQARRDGTFAEDTLCAEACSFAVSKLSTFSANRQEG